MLFRPGACILVADSERKNPMKTLKTLALTILLASLSLNCAWWQKHEPQFDCALLDTVQDASVLISIIEQCTQISVTPDAILPCVEGAASNKWTSDVIQCFTAASQGKANCPAYKAAKEAKDRKNVVGTTSPSGMVFTVASSGTQVVVTANPGIVLNQSVSPMVLRALAPSQAVAAQIVAQLPQNIYNYAYQGAWSAVGSPPSAAVCYSGSTCSPTWTLGTFYAALMAGVTGYRAAFASQQDCSVWVAAQLTGGLGLQCTYGWFNVVSTH